MRFIYFSFIFIMQLRIVFGAFLLNCLNRHPLIQIDIESSEEKKPTTTTTPVIVKKPTNFTVIVGVVRFCDLPTALMT